MIFLLFSWCVKSARGRQAQAVYCKKKNVGSGGSPAPWRAWANGDQVNPCWSFLFFLNLWPCEGFGRWLARLVTLELPHFSSLRTFTCLCDPVESPGPAVTCQAQPLYPVVSPSSLPLCQLVPAARF